MRVTDLEAIRIKLASPEDILSWSHGEVTKPETINYRTQRAEKDGLFDERIFGPEKDFECYCGKYRKVRYKGIVCDRCGVEVTKASVRRERMGHIKLAAPCSHIWFLRGMPSRMGLVMDIPAQQLERVIYFAAYMVTSVDEQAKKGALREIDEEYARKSKGTESEEEKAELKEARDRARQEIALLRPLGILSEVEYQQMARKFGRVFEAGTGAETLHEVFSGLDLKQLAKQLYKDLEEASPQTKKRLLVRIKVIQGMARAGIRPEWMFLIALPVLPPDLRPMVQLDGGRYASSDLNDLYRRVINRNNRLKYLLDLGAPDVIVRNEKRMLQESVDALIDNSMRKGSVTSSTTGGRRLLKSLADMLKGKQGRFRQNLLGKRVDYSGRSVIVAGPSLKLHQCGIPKHMALELFKPFVIQKILEAEFAYNVKGATRLIEQQTDDVWAILEEVVKGRVVLLNRAPTLHRLGIQGFYPVLVEGSAIRLHPLVCPAFNADFDGDQMAIHVPLSEEAQREARELMLSSENILKPATGAPIATPVLGMVLGCYYLTEIDKDQKDRPEKELRAFASPEEALHALERGVVHLRELIRVRIRGELVATTAGRLVFNGSLPEGYPFVNEHMNKKGLQQLIGDVIRTRSREDAIVLLDSIKSLGFEYATKSGMTWGMDDLVIPEEKPAIMAEAEKEAEAVDAHWRRGLLSREERYAKVVEIWTRAKTSIEKLVPQALPVQGSVLSIINSGAKGSLGQTVQMAGMKGLVTNPSGRIIELPIKSSFKEGMDVLEFFISTHAARKGTADTALRTSTAGYLTRRLIDVAHNVIVTEEDCGDTKGIVAFKKDADELGQSMQLKIAGRVSLESVKTYIKKGGVITPEAARSIEKDEEVQEVRVRSPLSCKAVHGVCAKCYGWDLGRNEDVKMGSAVGIVAAQSIGEPGTQLTMRTFHSGGVAGGGDITQGLPRVEEIFEGRVPGGKAVLSEVDGVVKEITPDNIVRIIVAGAKSKKEEIVEYEIPAKRAIWVQKGASVEKGQQLCEGNLDLRELFLASGRGAVESYAVKEVQRIYSTQGANVHDKHIEIMARQMFSRFRVKDRGDSTLVTEGEIVDRGTMLEESARLEKLGKQPMTGTQLLLGISKVALNTESWLSAASFQETSRILISASLEGKEDRLRGLKENVIIGKLVPSGTGFSPGT